MEDFNATLIILRNTKPFSSDYFYAIAMILTYELYRDTYFRLHFFRLKRHVKKYILKWPVGSNTRRTCLPHLFENSMVREMGC